MPVVDITHEIDERVEFKIEDDKPVLLCLLSGHSFAGMRGSQACSDFKFVATDLSHRLQDKIIVAMIDFMGLSVGATVCGWTMYKPLPRLILFDKGKKMAARTLSLSEVRSPRVLDKLTEWITQSLVEK